MYPKPSTTLFISTLKSLIIASLSVAFIITTISFKPKNVLIDGYDPVSYFQGNPQIGKEKFSYVHNGTAIWFVNDANRIAFIENSGKYFPKYGGWCAYAMGKDGSKVNINPLTYKIIDNELYLFYNKLGTNTLELWNDEGAAKLKNSADNYWLKLEDKSANN